MRLSCLKYGVAIIISFLFFVQHSLAFNETPLTSIGIDQGLSNNSVRCILQDHKGFLWFGTFDGLNRYDGYTFRVFRNNLQDAGSLSNNVVNALCEDRNGNIWVGTRKGLSMLGSFSDRFTPISYQRGKNHSQRLDDVIRVLVADRNNNILIGMENGGLLLCKGRDTVARQIPLQIGGSKATEFGVQALKVSESGSVWAFVQNRGLCQLDYASMTLRLINATVLSASSLALDGTDLWIGTSAGVYRYQTASNTCTKAFDAESGKLTSNVVATLIMDKDHNLWIGTNGGGINIWNAAAGKMDILQAGDSRSSLTSGAVAAIYEDKESRKWIGTLRGGINIIDPRRRRFQVVAHDPAVPGGFSGNFVSCFFEAPDSSLWIGTEDAGLDVWDRQKNRFTNYRYHSSGGSLPSNTVASIQGDGQNNIWITTFANGITRLDPRTGGTKRYRCINPANGMENEVAYVLYLDSRHRLWATTLRQGNRYGALYFYNEVADRFEAFDTNLSDLFSLREDRQGTLWGGNLAQLVRIDRESRKHRFYALGHPVRAIREDKKGAFWVGTEGGGLVLFDRESGKIAARYTTKDGLCHNSVLNILEDAEGNLWMSTMNGLSRFDPVSRTFKNYYQSDGLQSNQFSYNAALSLRSGELVFGGIKGFSLFHPARIRASAGAPSLVISGIKVEGEPIAYNSSFVVEKSADEIRELKVPYNKAIFSIDFAALEYSAPDKIQYAYYLEGWDRNWNYSGNLRTANYTHLSEGTYTFQVKSTNAEGEWGSKGVAFAITVLPPWYRSWWAYTLYLLMTGGAIFLYQRYKVYQTKLKYEAAMAYLDAEKQRAEYRRQQAELEAERAEKEKGKAELEREHAELEKKEAELAREHAERETERVLNEKERELSERQRSFFTYISHEFRTPLSLIINPIKDLLQKRKEESAAPDSELPVVFRNARRLLSMVDQLLLFRKAESGMDVVRPAKLDVCSLTKEVYLCFTQQAKARNITYRFECPAGVPELYADPQKLEIILYNLLSNALKYTPYGGTITLRLSEREQDMEIVVEDTGAGIPKEAGDQLFEKFYQPDRRDARAGFGIGLYLVKQFVLQHKGDISYRSEEGVGTVFTLYLPKGKEHFGPGVTINEEPGGSFFLQELKEETEVEELAAVAAATEQGSPTMADVVTEKQTVLVVDDDEQIRQYLVRLFKDTYLVYQADTGEEGLRLAQQYLPDLVISDVHMHGMTGIELCKAIKEDSSLSHIPVILLTASASDEVKLQGVEGGADDYITKPFDNKLLMARVSTLLKSRNTLQKYFYNEITLNKTSQKISTVYKEFLDRCIAVVESHLEDEDFSVQTLVAEMSMSYSNLYRKVKSVSGQSINTFVRFIRLRKAAELFINTDYNVNETAFMVGIRDAKYFREQFNKLFGMNPSEYIRKYRKVHGKQYTVNKDSINPGDTAGRDNR